VPTLFGNPTTAELDELIAAKDATVVATTAQSAKTLPVWRARDAAGADTWAVQWQALRDRYNAARGLRVNASSSTLSIPPEVVWHAIMKSIRQAWDVTGSLTQSAPESTGDLQNLVRRLSAEGDAPDFSKVPQPVATDPALEIFKAADVAVRLAPGGFAGLGWLIVAYAVSKMFK